MKEVTASYLKEKLASQANFFLLDVREPREYHTLNIGGTNIALSKLEHWIDETDLTKDTEIIVICQHGVRSKTAQSLLKANGFLNTFNLKGGMVSFQRIA